MLILQADDMLMLIMLANVYRDYADTDVIH